MPSRSTATTPPQNRIRTSTSTPATTPSPPPASFLQTLKLALRFPWSTTTADTTADNDAPEQSPEREQPEEETVLYLAYGSNLCAATFLHRRGISPLSKRNVVVPRLQLVFDLPGIPYLEPRFANSRVVPLSHPPDPDLSLESSEEDPLLILAKREDEAQEKEQEEWNHGLVGVVYEVTSGDFAKIIASEGGGSSYADILIDCIPLPPTSDPFLPPSSSLLSIPPIKAHTLLCPPTKSRRVPGLPSPRYLDLICTGARENKLPGSYQNYLASLKPYRRTGARQRVGGALFAVMWFPIMIAVFGLTRAFAGRDGRAPGWLVGLSEAASRGMWVCYEGVFRGPFGNGEMTGGGRGKFLGEEV
ncbi:hypothetical protein RUND412_009423 [Rhizina undulata]